MMTREELKSTLTDTINEMDNSDLMFLNNEYCLAVNDFDSMLHPMDELDEELAGTEPMDAIRMALNGYAYSSVDRERHEPFTTCAEYFSYNGYANLMSVFDADVLDFVPVSDIVDYIIRNDDALSNDELQDILDEYNEENEEDEED